MARERPQTSAKEFIDRFNSLGIVGDDDLPVTVTKGTVSKLVNGQEMPLLGVTFTATMRWLADNTDPTKPKSKLGTAAQRWLSGQGAAPIPPIPKAPGETPARQAEKQPTVAVLPMEEGISAGGRNSTVSESRREKRTARRRAEEARTGEARPRAHSAGGSGGGGGCRYHRIPRPVRGFAGLLARQVAGKTDTEAYTLIQAEVRRLLERLSTNLRKAAIGLVDELHDGGAVETGRRVTFSTGWRRLSIRLRRWSPTSGPRRTSSPKKEGMPGPYRMATRRRSSSRLCARFGTRVAPHRLRLRRPGGEVPSRPGGDRQEAGP
ncbi:hypothetical protein [Azospirillum sp. TSH58]|uniref:hypothetical protein n=1 Tax=Azospirillum sp. TSH58 TaxID=664962 RepID=UPI0013A58DED|nr:hypothetical protein [Azospirillum sp. TSH58]